MKKLMQSVLLMLAMSVIASAGDNANLCNVNFTVTREWNGKPVRNAAIVLHPVDKNGKQRANGVELKADSEGKASFPALPYGKVRVQVLAPGLQTYGQDFEIKDKTMEIEVKLKKPQDQYSIYGEKKSDQGKEKDKDKEKDAPKK